MNSPTGKGGNYLGQRVQELEKQVAKLSKTTSQLKEHLRVDPTHSLEGLIGKSVIVHDVQGNALSGTIEWVDKFHIGFKSDFAVSLLFKGNLIRIQELHDKK